MRGGPLRALVDRTAAGLGVRCRVAIGISSVSHGPILAGVIRPTILIPETLVSELMTNQMRSIIAHELAHARRRDNLLLLVQRFAEMLIFFHPVVWLGGRMMRREAESACDDAVLNRIGDSARYADSLTRVAEMRFTLTQRFLVNTFAAAETNFTRRIRRILDNPMHRMTVRASLASVGTLIFIGCIGLPRVAELKSVGGERTGLDLQSGKSAAAEGVAMTALKPQLDWVPSGKPDWHTGWMNGYARGLDLVLNHLGQDADYVTIMGDMGLAFIMQGEENSTNVYDGAVDVGWWPLEPLGIVRLSFLEKTVGREIQDIKLPSGGGNPITSYKQWFESAVTSSIGNGKPCLLRVGSAWYIITGHDREEMPLIGMCPNEEAGNERIYRLDDEPMPPYAGFTIGGAIPTIDRETADLEALKFAVALHRDQVLGPDADYGGNYPLRRADEFGTYWRTGLKSFASWIACLEDAEHPGQPYWHGNVVSHLYWNRTTAVRYLKAMQKRHSATVAAHLENAIQKYQAVIEEVGKADTSGESLSSAQGRGELILRIRRISKLESEAVAELEKALEALG